MGTRTMHSAAPETYKRDVQDWEVGMHEFLAEKDFSDEELQLFMEAVCGEFADKAGMVKAPGVYRGRKRLRLRFNKKIFVKDDARVSTESSEEDKKRITELEAKLANAALEMEKAKA